MPEEFLRERFSLKGGEKPCVTLVRGKVEEKNYVKPNVEETNEKDSKKEENKTKE